MASKIIAKITRFLSIVGGFSSPEDIEQAKQKSIQRKLSNTEKGSNDTDDPQKESKA